MGSDNLWICVIMAPAGRCRRDSASVTYDSTLPQPHPPAPTAGTILTQIPAIGKPIPIGQIGRIGLIAEEGEVTTETIFSGS